MAAGEAKLFNPNDLEAWRRRLGRGVEMLPLAAPGACHDCRRARTLRRYGRLEVCAQCAGLRLGAAVATMRRDELAAFLRDLKRSSAEEIAA